MATIKLLDCTLRDGGHLNGSDFGEEIIKDVVRKLVMAKIDIIEIGFLIEEFTGPDVAKFTSIEEVKKYLPENMGNSKISLMADFINVDALEPCDGTVEHIRLSFKRHRLDWALSAAKTLIAKGYKCFINPVNCNVYSDTEFIEVIRKVNELDLYSFSIVDTFGVMRKDDLSRVYYLVNNNLKKSMLIGLHLHENLGLAYSLAQHFIEINVPTRDIVVDCSLLGMGRIPGNLCAEQIMDHLNYNFGKRYENEYALDAIDDYISPLKDQLKWGYSIPYSLSAQFGVHRTYAEHLMNKRRLKTKEILRILSKIEPMEIETFNEGYIDQLYDDYMNIEIDDKKYYDELKQVISNYDQVMIIAPGQSITKYNSDIIEFVTSEKPFIISINFVPDFINPHYVFCSNIKRYEKMSSNENKYIISSNLLNQDVTYDYIFSYNDLTNFNGVSSNDSTLMMLTILKKIGIDQVSIAGFDGMSNNSLSFYDSNFEKRHVPGNNLTYNLLKNNFDMSRINFITPSVYDQL